jgi:hypothetical protein
VSQILVVKRKSTLGKTQEHIKTAKCGYTLTPCSEGPTAPKDTKSRGQGRRRKEEAERTREDHYTHHIPCY